MPEKLLNISTFSSFKMTIPVFLKHKSAVLMALFTN